MFYENVNTFFSVKKTLKKQFYLPLYQRRVIYIKRKDYKLSNELSSLF